jgi:adenylate cyclase class 2
MYEVEVKVPADHAAVRERLAECDAERVGAVEQVDTYYGAPHREFAETDEALRMREETPAGGAPTHEVTYKGPKVDADSKAREEHESAVADPEAVDAALRALGFDPAATVRKDRERFRLSGYTVTLDAVEGLGEFVEVERTGEAGDVDDLRAGAFAVLGDLDLDPDDQIRRSYLGLLVDAGDSRE